MSGWYVAAALYVLGWIGIGVTITRAGWLLGKSAPRWAMALLTLPWPLLVVYMVMK